MISRKIIEDLESQISGCEQYDDNMNEASFGYENGVVISGNDAKEILAFIKSKTEKDDVLNVKDGLE